ncbi:MAG: alkaline phosphatase family protein [Pseudobdellovibrio sp.]
MFLSQYKLYAVAFLAIILNSCSNKAPQAAAQDQNFPPALKTDKTDQNQTHQPQRLPEFICQDRENDPAQINKPIVIMLSIDGFRADYIKKYNPKYLKMLSQNGLYSTGLIPSFPSHTFPNHYSIATGRVPGHHGIVSNKFYDKARKKYYSMADISTSRDGSWYDGMPIWNVVEKNNLIAHTYHWVGSEAHVNQMDPTCYINYSDSIKLNEKVSKTIEWLKLPDKKRPHLITLYTPVVDSAGHYFGPDSTEVKNAIMETDNEIGRLWNYIKSSSLKVNLILVSDHGMQNTDLNKVIYINELLDNPKDVNAFALSDRGPVTMLYSDDASMIKNTYLQLKQKENHYKVYLKGETPTELKLDHPDRIGDIVMIADMPYYIIDQRLNDQPPRLNKGTHGWHYDNPEMRGLFIAIGPNIKPKTTLAPFKNIDIYPFIMSILDITTTTPYDGDFKTLKPYVTH